MRKNLELVRSWMVGEADLPIKPIIRVQNRFYRKLIIDPNSECLHYETSFLDRGGYAHASIMGILMPAHRLAYRLFVGPISPGMHIDHIWNAGCRYNDCCNWYQHLEPVTPGENHRRMQAKRYSSDAYMRLVDMRNALFEKN